MTGRMTNGSGHHPEQEPDDNVASLDEARRRAKAKAKASAKLDRVPSTARDKIVGGVFILMALGMIGYGAAKLFGAF